MRSGALAMAESNHTVSVQDLDDSVAESTLRSPWYSLHEDDQLVLFNELHEEGGLHQRARLSELKPL